jgi:hypothetical protein
MPTYRLRCKKCFGEFETWCSIHDPLPASHEVFLEPSETIACRGELVQVITGVRTYGVGTRGEATRQADAMDARIDEARPSYKRMRDAGLQPTSVMDSPRLERHGDDPMYVESGGLVAVPEHRRTEVREMLAEANQSSWSPIDAVHEQRSA